MELSRAKQIEYKRRIQLSRIRLMCNYGFYGMLLMHLNFSIDSQCGTACTDGDKIYFDPSFLDKISDDELDFILMHELLHIVFDHCARTGDRDNELFNIACDIVVNSNILKSMNMELQSITLKEYGVSMHVAPDGNEGYLYTAEEVYKMLLSGSSENSNSSRGNKNSVWGSGGKKSNKSGRNSSDSSWDNHSRWGKGSQNSNEKEENRQVWANRIQTACELMEHEGKMSGKNGNLPAGIERLLKELRAAQTNWRQILNDFIQEEINDYSFSPPDRRFQDSPFMLPDFNDRCEVIKNVLFMIDTSGSMSEKEITDCYAEIVGAIDQFDGKLEGWVGFFDAEVIEPKPFTNEDELKIIRPYGGGGTNFKCVFDYIDSNMSDVEISSIIILTDGYAPFPDISVSRDIPVLWIINNKEILPPWGKVTRITS